MRLKLVFLVICLLASTATGAEINARLQLPIVVYRWANGTANVDAFADWLGRDLV